MSDQILRAMSTDGWVKAVAISSRGIAERARQIHTTTPTATAALGRVLTACSMLGNMQKIEESSLTLQVKGGGPLGTVLAVSDAAGNVRGYVQNPHVSLLEKYAGKLDVGAAVGTNGMLTVIRDLQMKEPYVGSVELVSGEIGDDVTAYLAQSEQCPSSCGLGVLIDTDCTVRAAGGFILQLLPGAPDSVITRLEQALSTTDSVTKMLDAGMSLPEMLRKVTDGMELEFFEPAEVSYKCYCTRERVEATLVSLGRKELQSIIDEGKPIQVECQFCDTEYKFTPEDVRRILSGL